MHLEKHPTYPQKSYKAWRLYLIRRIILNSFKTKKKKKRLRGENITEAQHRLKKYLEAFTEIA